MSEENNELENQVSDSEDSERDIGQEVLDGSNEITEDQAVDQEEQEAKAHGHLSKEEYQAKHGTLEGYKDAKEFNEYGKKFEANEVAKLRKAVEKRDKELEATLKYINDVKERERAKAKKELEDALKQAKYTGDVEATEKLTVDKIRMDQAEQIEKQQVTQSETTEAYNWFLDRNKHWYNSANQGLVNEATNIEAQILNGSYRTARGLPVAQPRNYLELAEMVEIAMQEKHPELSTEQVETKPTYSPSRSAVNKTASSSTIDKLSLKDLTDQQRTVYEAGCRIAKQNGLKPESVSAFKSRWERNYED